MIFDVYNQAKCEVLSFWRILPLPSLRVAENPLSNWSQVMMRPMKSCEIKLSNGKNDSVPFWWMISWTFSQVPLKVGCFLCFFHLYFEIIGITWFIFVAFFCLPGIRGACCILFPHRLPSQTGGTGYHGSGWHVASLPRTCRLLLRNQTAEAVFKKMLNKTENWQHFNVIYDTYVLLSGQSSLPGSKLDLWFLCQLKATITRNHLAFISTEMNSYVSNSWAQCTLRIVSTVDTS